MARILAIALVLQNPIEAVSTNIMASGRMTAASRTASASASETSIRTRAKRRSLLSLAAAKGTTNANTVPSRLSLLARNDEVMAPLLNDTLTAGYWAQIDSAIEAAELTSPPPVASDAVARPTAEPYRRVFEATRIAGDISADDLTPEEIANSEELASVSVGVSGQDAFGTVRRVSVVPYDMQLGAHLLYELSEKATKKPPPSQGLVDQQFVAQCPMIMFGNSLQISAPKCGQKLGDWSDPGTGRKVLRWGSLEDGSLRFGVDSVIGGNGSALYALMSQQMSLKGVYFDLINCLNVKRYTVEESVIKVDHIGRGVTSSIQEHDISTATKAFFYKYTIRHANGTAVAESGLFRQNQNEVNVSMFKDEVSNGALIATATREGHWTEAAWRECSHSKRAWTVNFKISSRDFETVATVMDLRVALTTMFTLMAFRSEVMDKESGVARDGEKAMVKQLIWSCIIVVLAIIVIFLLCVVLKMLGWDSTMRRYCFKFEHGLLPKRPTWKRQAPMPSTW